MHIGHFVELLHRAELDLADACAAVADQHGDEPDVRSDCQKFENQCRRHAERLAPFLAAYPNEPTPGTTDPRRLFKGPRSGPLGLLTDLHDLLLSATECDVAWTLIAQAASALRDRELLAVAAACEPEIEIQATWFKSRMKQAAPQALVVAR